MPESKDAHPHPELWRIALERAQLGVWDWDLRTGSCFYSPTWSGMLGYGEGDLPKSDDLWLNLTHPEDRERAVASGDRHIAGLTEGIETELRLKHKDGRWVWVLDRGGVVERDPDGNPVRVIGVQTDITHRKAAEAELEHVNTRFRLALTASGVGLWHHDLDTKKSVWDDRTREIFGIFSDAEELTNDTWRRFLHPQDKEVAEKAHDIPVGSTAVSAVRYRIILRDGSVRHVETLARYVSAPNSSGQLVGTIRDISDEVFAADALNLEKERLRVTLRSISDAIVSTDVDGRISFVNQSAMAMLRCREDELVGCGLAGVLGPLCAAGSGKGGHHGALVDLAVGSAGTISVRYTASPILSSAGEILGSVYTLQDVTEEHRRQQELAYAARHDALTGLLNRAAFDARLAEMIVAADGQPFGVLYIDLDYFKALNDSAGHAAGDAALKSVAWQIQSSLPAAACCARLGGDEFVALVPLREDAEAAAAAERLLDAIRNADLGPNVRYRKLAASIGIAVVRSPSMTAADALACADDACYAAKASGRNRVAAVPSNVTASTSGLNAARMAADVVEALEDGRLKLFGQEIRSLETPSGRPDCVEVLARLVGRNGKLTAPIDFIPAAERFGVAAKLDRWIIATALNRFNGALASGSLPSIGFNLSAQTLSDPDLWDFVGATIKKTKTPPVSLVFEITETAAVTNFEAAERFVRRARDHGCRVSLDDFGAGLSSFDYLRRFPVDIIKIEGSFIQNMARAKFDREIVSSISTFAKSLGYSLVAEKIENVETLGLLQRMDVTCGQGFLLHRPEPLDEIVRRLSSGNGAVGHRAA